MREIKFRVWSTIQNKYKFPVLDVTNDFNLHKEKGHVFQQYTGLKDAIGKEIYEGDVISFAFRTKDANFLYQGVVVFDEFMFVVDVPNGDGFSLNRINSVNVIGNIHQNPELWQD